MFLRTKVEGFIPIILVPIAFFVCSTGLVYQPARTVFLQNLGGSFGQLWVRKAFFSFVDDISGVSFLGHLSQAVSERQVQSLQTEIQENHVGISQ